MLLRIIDKNTGLFIRDDFSFDPETELGLDVEPSQGLWQPKATFKQDNTFDKWVEGGQAPIDTRTYEEKLIALIRERYSIDDEIALANKGIADSTNAEYVAYRAYVEQLKADLKK